MHYELGLRDHLVPMLHGVDCQVSQAHTIHRTTLYISAHSPCLLGVFLHYFPRCFACQPSYFIVGGLVFMPLTQV